MLSPGRAPPGLSGAVACAGPPSPAGCPRPSSPAALGSFVAGGWSGLAGLLRPCSPACPLGRRLSRRCRLGRSRLRLRAGRCRFTPAAGFSRGRRTVPVVAQALSPGVAARFRPGRPRFLGALSVRSAPPIFARGPAAPLARGRRCRARPGPAPAVARLVCPGVGRLRRRPSRRRFSSVRLVPAGDASSFSAFRFPRGFSALRLGSARLVGSSLRRLPRRRPRGVPFLALRLHTALFQPPYCRLRRRWRPAPGRRTQVPCSNAPLLLVPRAPARRIARSEPGGGRGPQTHGRPAPLRGIVARPSRRRSHAVRAGAGSLRSPALPLTVLQPLSASLRAAAPSASLPWGPLRVLCAAHLRAGAPLPLSLVGVVVARGRVPPLR